MLIIPNSLAEGEEVIFPARAWGALGGGPSQKPLLLSYCDHQPHSGEGRASERTQTHASHPVRTPTQTPRPPLADRRAGVQWPSPQLEPLIYFREEGGAS